MQNIDIDKQKEIIKFSFLEVLTKLHLHPVADVKFHEASLADHRLSTVLVSILDVDYRW